MPTTMEAVAMVICGCMSLAAAQVPGFGSCPTEVQAQSSLDIARYLGVWYEAYKFPDIFELGQRCVSANYTLKDNGHIRVDNIGYTWGSQTTRKKKKKRTQTTMKSLVAIVMCGCLALTAAQVPGVGPCPSTIKSQSSLNVTRYLGGWYEMYRFPAVFESGQICNTANYTLKADGHIKVDNQGYKQGEYKEAIADAFAPNASEPAQLAVQFGPGAPYTPYWVIDTDYENYSLVYSCGTVLGSAAHVEFAWILSRWPQIDPPTADRLKKLLKDGGINVGFFSQTVQTNCPGRAQ